MRKKLTKIIHHIRWQAFERLTRPPHSNLKGQFFRVSEWVTPICSTSEMVLAAAYRQVLIPVPQP
jgi:hypothetical protein